MAVLVNSGEFDGLSSADAFNAIADALAEKGRGSSPDQLPAPRLAGFQASVTGAAPFP